jgi:tetratricopeptide (TPR) repeat protein
MNSNDLNTQLRELQMKIAKAVASNNQPLVNKLCSELIATYEPQGVDNKILASAYLSRGVSRRIAGDKQGALDDYSKTAKLYPNSFEPHLNAALVLAEDLKNYKRGIEEFDLALRYNPTNASILSSRGVAKFSSGDYEGAEADYTAALAIQPNNPDFWFNMGCLQLRQDRLDEAIKSFEATLKINPKDRQCQAKLAQARERLKPQGLTNKQIREAEKRLRKAQRDEALYTSHYHFEAKKELGDVVTFGLPTSLPDNSQKAATMHKPGRGCALFLFILLVGGIIALIWYLI